MHLRAKFGGLSSFGNVDTNSYIKSYMNNSGKAELTASIHHTERFSNSEIPVYNVLVPNTGDRKTSKVLCTSRKRKHTKKPHKNDM